MLRNLGTRTLRKSAKAAESSPPPNRLLLEFEYVDEDAFLAALRVSGYDFRGCTISAFCFLLSASGFWGADSCLLVRQGPEGRKPANTPLGIALNT